MSEQNHAVDTEGQRTLSGVSSHQKVHQNSTRETGYLVSEQKNQNIQKNTTSDNLMDEQKKRETQQNIACGVDNLMNQETQQNIARGIDNLMNQETQQNIACGIDNIMNQEIQQDGAYANGNLMREQDNQEIQDIQQHNTHGISDLIVEQKNHAVDKEEQEMLNREHQNIHATTSGPTRELNHIGNKDPTKVVFRNQENYATTRDVNKNTNDTRDEDKEEQAMLSSEQQKENHESIGDRGFLMTDTEGEQAILNSGHQEINKSTSGVSCKTKEDKKEETMLSLIHQDNPKSICGNKCLMNEQTNSTEDIKEQTKQEEHKTTRGVSCLTEEEANQEVDKETRHNNTCGCFMGEQMHAKLSGIPSNQNTHQNTPGCLTVKQMNHVVDKQVQTKQPKVAYHQDMHEDTICGIGCFRGPFLQRFANKKAYVFLYGVLGCIFSASYAYSTGTITTIEKRFKIPSRNTGKYIFLKSVSVTIKNISSFFLQIEISNFI